VDMQGNVYVCGLGVNGQLGLGDNDTRNVPTLIPDIRL
jgi:alpha-tubulin suppressor-like RCC1 family protein